MDEQSYLRDYHIAKLIEGHIAGRLNPEEQAELNLWINGAISNRELWEQLTDVDFQGRALTERQSTMLDLPLARIHTKIARQRQGSRRVWMYRASAAATILLFIGIWAFFAVKKKDAQSSTNGDKLAAAQTILPAQPSAQLYLSGGRSIALNNRTDTVVGALRIKNGAVAYGISSAPTEINTLITPYGGTYKLVLEDGTKVWLNAASELKFPARFTAAERHVALKGEGYFEIASDAKRPFIVTANQTSVRVLGTTLDIQNYQSDVVKTTLISGKVSVAGQGGSKLLVPGQMALATPSGMALQAADIEQVLAWKNDRFIHRDADIKEVMEEIARWYNVEVVYEGNYRKQADITMEISRQVSLGEVLEMLEASGACSFKVEGRRITVVAQ